MYLAPSFASLLQYASPLNAADPMNFGSANLWLVNPSGLLLGPMRVSRWAGFRDQLLLEDDHVQTLMELDRMFGQSA